MFETYLEQNPAHSKYSIMIIIIVLRKTKK